MLCFRSVIRALIAEAYESAKQCLSDHRDQLDKLALTLLERETLSVDEVRDLLGIPRPPEDEDAPAKKPETDAPEVPASEPDSTEAEKSAADSAGAEPAAAKEEGKTLSLPEVRAILAKKVGAGFGNQIKALIESYGVASLKYLPAERYGELLDAVADLGTDGDADAG